MYCKLFENNKLFIEDYENKLQREIEYRQNMQINLANQIIEKLNRKTNWSITSKESNSLFIDDLNFFSGCIVLFDEAFNNMDESRIDAMMKFYNSLSIQLLIAVPPQRVSNIINYVNTSLVIVKENDYAIVETFKDERMIRL